MKRGIKKKKRRREKFTNRKRKKEREKKEGKKKENNGYDKVGYDFRPSVRYRWINNKPEWQWQFRGIQKLEPCLPRTVGRLISLSRHVNARRLQPRKGLAAFFPYTHVSYTGWERGRRFLSVPGLDLKRVSLSNFSKKDRITVSPTCSIREQNRTETIPSHNKSSTSEIDVNFDWFDSWPNDF